MLQRFKSQGIAALLPRSLKARLMLAALLVMPVVTLFAGAALQRAFHNSLQASEETQARLHVYLLLGDAELRDGKLWLPQTLPDPRFSQLQSGLYGLVNAKSGELLWRSPSAQLLPDKIVENLPKPNLKPGQSLFSHLPQTGLFLFQYPLSWEYEGQERSFLISILHTDQDVEQEMNAFMTQLWGWLGGVFLLALSLQYVILRWALRPLDHLAQDLKHIEGGEADKLTGYYPLEIQAVTDNLNRLIESERQQGERYRNTLGDLAHSLKTPLAVMQGAESEGQTPERYRTLVKEQAQRMSQIVQYQLARAVRSHSQVIPRPVDIEPVVSRIVHALEKVYARKQMLTRIQVEPGLRFGGDERDLMELMGNILENAFKYGLSEVVVHAWLDHEWVVIDVADDGPSISPEQRQSILQRGERLDSSSPGQGLGLSVAVDILSSYNGALEISDSPLGGASFRVQLPAYH